MGRGNSVLPRVLARIYLGDVLRYTLEQGSDARTVLLRDTLQPDDICELDRRILRTLAETFLNLSRSEEPTLQCSSRSWSE